MRIASILWRVALTVVLGILGWTIYRVPRIWSDHSAANRQAALEWGDRQAQATRDELLSLAGQKFDNLERSAAREIQATRRDALKAIDDTQKAVVGEIREIHRDANAQLGLANGSLAKAVAPAEPLRVTLEHVDKQFLQSGIVQSRFLAVTGEAMRTMDAGRRIAEVAAQEAPATAKAVREGTESMAGIADSGERIADVAADLAEGYTRPKKWYQRVYDVAKTASYVVVRALF